MKTIRVTQEAIQTMWRLSRGCPTETGGPLLGTLEDAIVLEAGNSGSMASLKPYSFTSDPNCDRAQLSQARDRWGRNLHLLGYWHKHPIGMIQSSGGDLSQARRLLEDLHASGETAPWLLVFIVQDSQAAAGWVHPFRLDWGDERFISLKLNIVASDDKEVQAALSAASAKLMVDQKDPEWLTPDYRFHRTPSGKRRLEAEKAGLEKLGFTVQVRHNRADDRLSFIVQRPDAQYLCLLPKEYPLTMARIFSLPLGEEIYPLLKLPVWNSDLTLADYLTACPVSETSGFVPNKAAPAAENRPEWSIWLPAGFLSCALSLTMLVLLSKRRKT